MVKKKSLQQWREDKGLSKADLAKSVGITTRSIYNYETEGFKSASFKTVMKIIEELSIELNQLEIK